MNEYTPELSIVGIVGFLVPFVAQLIKRPTWSSEKRRVVSAVVSVVLALVALIGVGALSDLVISSPQQIVVVCLGVLGVAQLVFTGLQAAVPNVMNKLEAAGAPAQPEQGKFQVNQDAVTQSYPTEVDLTPPPADFKPSHRLNTEE